MARFFWGLFGGMALLILVAMGSFYFFFLKPAGRAARAPMDSLATALSHIFKTEVKSSGASAVLSRHEIGELALIERKTQAITKYQATWLRSTKTLIVRGSFMVKAGFDLSKGGRWKIIDGKITGDLPKGKVLSVEPLGDFEIYHSESGAINRLTSKDHALVFNLLKRQARKDAEKSNIGKEAETLLMVRIHDLMGASIGTLEWGNAKSDGLDE